MRWPWQKVEPPSWPSEINGYQTRPRDGSCPGCGVPENHWCEPDCTLLDPGDYR